VENELLKEEIRVSRESAEITASLVVRQFEETERVLARLQVANAQRKAVLDSAVHMAIVATDQRGTIILFNKGAERLLGYTAEEVIGKTTPLIFHIPGELNRRAGAIREATGIPIKGVDLLFYYANQVRQEQQWTYVRKDGGTVPVTMSVNPLRDADGNLDGFLCIATDITEKMRSEQALKQSERNYRLLINNIPNIVFKGYADGSVEFFDDKIEKLTGYPKELFLTRRLKWTDLIVEEDRQMAQAKLIEALRGNRQYFREYRIRKKNGEIVWLQTSSRIECDEEGRIDFISGAFLNITERKKAEAALHESEEKYRSLFDSGPNPIVVLDPDNLVILDVNPAAIDLYGYSKEELLGRSFTELGEFEISPRDPAMDTMDTGDNWADSCFINQKARHLKKDGSPFFIRVKACPIRYKDRMSLIVAATDITEAIEKDAQLFQSSKMQTLGEMSAGIAHELTQPLNAIKIGNDYLRRKAAQEKRISREDLERVTLAVTSQVQRASDIIKRLREFGRKPDFKKEAVDLNLVVANVMQIIGQQLVLNNIQVVYDLADALPPVMANQNRLEQVVFNLISNARDAIEQLPGNAIDAHNRVINIQSHATEAQVVLVVTDTGIGIPEEAADKIFEPFFTTKEVGKGMGLGLAISYGIIRDYNGTIVVGRNEKHGTRFELRFEKTAVV
jgi:PAS domain S-box-containing protein